MQTRTMETLTAGAERELVRYLAIAVETDLDMEMFSPFVDECWHDLLRDRGCYEAWCETRVGEVVAHDTSNRSDVAKDIPWISTYERRYGMLDPIWFLDREGRTMGEMVEIYRSTGRVVASWDCSPAKQTPVGPPRPPAPAPAETEPEAPPPNSP